MVTEAILDEGEDVVGSGDLHIFVCYVETQIVLTLKGGIFDTFRSTSLKISRIRERGRAILRSSALEGVVAYAYSSAVGETI